MIHITWWKHLFYSFAALSATKPLKVIVIEEGMERTCLFRDHFHKTQRTHHFSRTSQEYENCKQKNLHYLTNFSGYLLATFFFIYLPTSLSSVRAGLTSSILILFTVWEITLDSLTQACLLFTARSHRTLSVHSKHCTGPLNSLDNNLFCQPEYCSADLSPIRSIMKSLTRPRCPSYSALMSTLSLEWDWAVDCVVCVHSTVRTQHISTTNNTADNCDGNNKNDRCG